MKTPFDVADGLFARRAFPAHETIVVAGEPAHSAFVLLSGTAAVRRAEEGGGETPIGVLRPGDCFGEAALLAGGVRAATVVATDDVEVLEIDQGALDQLASTHPQVRDELDRVMWIHGVADFLARRTTFRLMPISGRARLAQLLGSCQWDAGDTVCRVGDPAGPVWLLREGVLEVLAEDGGSIERILSAGDVFGLEAVDGAHTRRSTVRVRNDAVVLELEVAAMEELAPDYQELSQCLAAVDR